MPALLFLLLMSVEPPRFAVEGRTEPARAASVTIYGAVNPFTASTLAGPDGRFRFKDLQAGSYTLAVFVPGLGESRQTVVLTPSTTDKRGRLQVGVKLDDTRMRRDTSSVVSMRELKIPNRARQLYAEAQKQLSKREIPAAVKLLEEAVDLAPSYSEAWNNLGTIAYQTQNYPRAEEMFQKALEADANSYAPLVNMGGVLLNLNRPDEAWRYNVHAVLKEPNDALAHAQLGMTYLALGKLDLAEKSLKEAIRLDAAHFSYPQIHLAEVYLRQGEKGQAADVLDHFLERHPDYPGAAKMREGITELRGAAHH